MIFSQTYIITAIVALAIVVILAFFILAKKQKKKMTPLAGVAFGFILAGIIFGEKRIVGYSLMGIGVILAFIDMIIKIKNKNEKEF